MKLNVQTPKEEGIVNFIDDEEVVKIGDTYYPIKYSLHDVETLYSLPNNDKHEPYIKRENVKLEAKVKHSVSKYWTPFKRGTAIKGRIQDDVFVVDR